MDLKAYFHEPYQGGESFINNVILPIFGEDKYDDAYEEDVIDNNPELERMAESTGISQILRLGTIDIPMNPTDVFDITVNNRVQMERNRVAIQMLIRRIMSTYSSAFMVFHYNDTNKWDWRFSFCSKQGNNSETTDSKRYTFLLGPNQSCRTATENFNKLAEKTGKIELDDIVKAFDVEVLSKEFFDKYKHHYECFCEYVYTNKDNTEYFGREFSECEDKIIRDYVKKLLGRIVFLHFLQKKGWMGVPADKEWGEGDLNFMRNLFNNASQSQKENFLDKVLKPLFEKGLDTDRTANNDLFDTGVEGFSNVKIPYLNGGLFEKDALDKPKARFSVQLFDDLLEFFYEYNFTIDENDPNDAQVGVDPEMLGRIFENLLEDNKDKGAFYTPKEIVQYMCKESLIAYLQTDVKTEKTKEAIRTFVTTYDVNAIGGKDSATAKDINEYLKDVKICDPAIGSGAFPMGMLKELFFCRGAIENFDDAAEIKRHIIQQNIYGVDIEKGAVDIARLRFWLALIVDEKTPHTLPNMDFKIMQGNSLLEQYKGVDLSRIMENKTISFGTMQIPFLENDIDESRRQLIALRKEYFHTYDKEKKKTLRKAMREKVQHLIDLTTNNLGGKYNGKHSETIDLSGIDIAATPEFFLWHTWFSDVFENGGFDIVIGNPPYNELRDLQFELQKLYKETPLYKYAKGGRVNMFQYFYPLGITLANKRGIISFITQNSLLAEDSALENRKYIFDKTSILKVDSFPERDDKNKRVFESAKMSVCILLLRKENNTNKEFDIFVWESRFMDKCKKIRLSPKDIKEIYKEDLTIPICDADTFNILLKLKSMSSKISINASSGEIDMTKYKHYFTNNNSQNVLRVVTGAQTLRYFLTDNPSQGGIKYLPVDMVQLSNKRRQIVSQKRIVMQRITGVDSPIRLIATILPSGMLCANSTNYISELNNEKPLEFILGVLNAKITNYFFKATSTNTNVTSKEISKLPIPDANTDEVLVIAEKVKEIIYTKQSSPQADTTSLEHEIDLLVYDLYGLTPEEIAIVEGTNKE